MSSSTYDYAIRLLSRRSYGSEELRRKLQRRGGSQDADSIIARFKELGYLNDEEYAYQRAKFRREVRHWGNHRIAQDLTRLGLNARIVELTLGKLDKECPEAQSFQQVTQAWIKSSGPPKSISQLKKLYAHCVRLGYSSEQVRSGLQKHFKEIGW
ncbi:MAG TPA: RecX family transcriptional regulator [Acidobacteriota bacterium]|nr:RecX family transcriptional regulator [Acidobacteriota bacterium]